jgi:SAM-dependent MidA family methyltransferase
MTDEQEVIVDVLRKQIQSNERQKISYSSYMETVLYHEKGYYQEERSKIGKAGDFYTSSSVHPVFAWVFASFFEQYCMKNDLPFRICELGGGTGAFAKQALDYLKQNKSERYKNLVYDFVDVSTDHRNVARELLTDHPNVSYYQSVKELQQDGVSYEGIIFSNELLDALPVHVIQQEKGELWKVMVTMGKDDRLKEVLEPLTDESIQEWLKWSGIEIPEGHRIEVPLQMMDWIREKADWLKEGLLVTVDYGYENEEILQPELRNGTLRGYHKHQLIEDPLSHPGKMDLTTHIHFDALIQKGEELGLRTIEFKKQREFLIEHGLFNHLVEHDNRDPFSEVSKLNRAIRSFATPGGISDAFHVLVQEKRK